MRTDRHILGRLLPALLSCICGCAGIPESARELPDPGIVVELTETPFFPQEQYQCGPAALATALSASGVEVSPDALVPKVYIPGRKGSLQVEMLAATRTSKRLPYVLDSSLTAIVRELQAGRPVLVLQNLGVSMIPRWHYAVVVGFDGSEGMVILRSGTEDRRLTRTKLFLRTWARSDFWAMVILRPGELPGEPDRERFLAAVADLEQVGMAAEASVAWRAALTEWPADPVARFGLGNSLVTLNQLDDAEAIYRELIAEHPDLVVARNNLAMTLHKQGRNREAMREIEVALEQADSPALIEELLDSKTQIQQNAPELRDR